MRDPGVETASVLEKADEVLLPTVYNEVGMALGVSPTALGSLTLCRALVQDACYPLAAYVRLHMTGLASSPSPVGAFLWAAAIFLVAISGSFLWKSDAQQQGKGFIGDAREGGRRGSFSRAREMWRRSDSK